MSSKYPELIFKRDEDFDEKRLNRAMDILDARLRALESFNPSWEEAIAVLRQYGLARLNEAVLPVYEQLNQVAQLGVIFTATSDSLVSVGTGVKRFELSDQDKTRFAAAAYLCAQKTGDSSIAMSGACVSYDRTLGILTLHVNVTVGSGTNDSWVISASNTPNLTHELRTDNPHHVTASQVGTYTSDQIDAAILSDINGIKAGVPTAYDNLFKIANYITADQASTASLQSAIALKANTSDVNVGLALKADAAATSAALALKADSAAINAAIAAKVSTPVRQTVLSGPLDASGKPACLSLGSGFNVSVKAGTICSFAAGFNTSGTVDYVAQVSADQSVAVDSVRPSYVYADRNPATGAIAFGSKTSPYQIADDGIGRPCASLLHFDTDFSDEYKLNWVTVGATLSATAFKFGTKSLSLSGVNQYLRLSSQIYLDAPAKWTFECWFKQSVINLNRTLFFIGGSGAPAVLFGFSATNFPVFYLSSTGASWDAANGILGPITLIDTANWHHVALVWDGASYKTYIDGLLTHSFNSSLSINAPATIALGANLLGGGFPAWYYNGFIDEVRFSSQMRYTTNFTPPTAPFMADETWDVFSPSQMKMISQPSNTPIQRVYLGECMPGATSLSSVTSYAYGGVYVSSPTNLTVGSNMLFAHNLGVSIDYQRGTLKIGNRSVGFSDPYSFCNGTDHYGVRGLKYTDRNNASVVLAGSLDIRSTDYPNGLIPAPQALCLMQRAF